MTDKDRQALLRQRLQEMGVMQGSANGASPVTASSHSRGFSGLALLMIVTAIITGVFIYWLTEKSSTQQSTSSDAVLNKTATNPNANAPEPARKQMIRSDSKPVEAEATDQAITGTRSTVNNPASRTLRRPYYPLYPMPAYRYPPVPYPPYARPYPPYYMAPPVYPYPPAPQR